MSLIDEFLTNEFDANKLIPVDYFEEGLLIEFIDRDSFIFIPYHKFNIF